MKGIKENNSLKTYLLITVGTFFMAIATNVIYEPLAMVTGGFSGIGIICKKIGESAFGISLPVGVTTILLNVPLFFLAIRIKGWEFLKKTIYASLCFSIALMFVPSWNVLHQDYLMAAVCGGTLQGIGIGLVFSQNTSTGGSDLLSTLLRNWMPGVSVSELLILVDGIIVLAGMGLFGIRTGLYAAVAVFITGKVSDALVDGVKFAKTVYIVSDTPLTISYEIMTRLNRGVTGLTGMGMYSGNQKQVLMCVVSKKEFVKLLEIVKSADKNAFVIVLGAKEVLGEGFLVGN
nr:YitT family protein [Eubacterium sp.]